MKKILSLFLVSLFIVSCQGPVGPEGPQGPQGYGTDWKIINLFAAPKDWTENSENGLNRYYFCHFPMPEINSVVFSDGAVIVYYLDSNNVQQPLPYVRHYQNSDGTVWTQTIDFDYSNGDMNIYVTNSNFAPISPTVDMNFRVVLMW